MEKIDVYDEDTKFEWGTIWIKNPIHRKGQDPYRFKATTKKEVEVISKHHNNYIIEELNLFPNQYIKPIFDKDSYDVPIDSAKDMEMIRKIFKDAVIKEARREPRMKNGKMFHSARYYVLNERIRANQLEDLIKFQGDIPNDYFDLSKYGKGGQFFTIYNTKKFDGDVPQLVPYNDPNPNIFDYYATYVLKKYKDWDNEWEQLQIFLAYKKEHEAKVVYKEDDEEVIQEEPTELNEIIKRLSPKRADWYPDWLKVVFGIMNYGVMINLDRRTIEGLIHQFSKKSIPFYEEDKVIKWIADNYERISESDAKHKLGRNFLINVCLKEDDNEYWTKTYRYRDYKIVLQDLTKECVKVRMGGKWLILRNEDDYNAEPYFLYDKIHLKHYYENEEIMCYKSVDKDKKDIMVNIVDCMSKYWKDMLIKSYVNIIYVPCPKQDITDKYFNTWFGWECMKYKGCSEDDEDVGIILKHLKEVWCDDNMELFEWWMDYLAYLVNGGRTGVVPIVRGTQGCGKDAFMSDFIRNKLLGARYCITTDDPVNHIFGRFNAGLLDKSYGVIEEGNYGLNNVYAKIKATATADKLSIEKKFADVVNAKNMINLIISTNLPCLITGDKGMEQRRIMNIKCSDRYLGNTEYFNKYRKAIDNGDAVKTIYNILVKRFKDKKLDPNNTMYLQNTKPDTKERDEVKEKTIPLTTQFLLDIIKIDDLKDGVSMKVNRTTLYTKYKSWCETRNIKCCDANSFYTTIAEVDNLLPIKSVGLRYFVIDEDVKKRLLELNKDDAGAEELVLMKDLVLY